MECLTLKNIRKTEVTPSGYNTIFKKEVKSYYKEILALGVHYVDVQRVKLK